MHKNRAAFENTLGVQGLPCLHTPSQGKPCTPASLLIAPSLYTKIVSMKSSHSSRGMRNSQCEYCRQDIYYAGKIFRPFCGSWHWYQAGQNQFFQFLRGCNSSQFLFVGFMMSLLGRIRRYRKLDQSGFLNFLNAFTAKAIPRFDDIIICCKWLKG